MHAERRRDRAGGSRPVGDEHPVVGAARVTQQSRRSTTAGIVDIEQTVHPVPAHLRGRRSEELPVLPVGPEQTVHHPYAPALAALPDLAGGAVPQSLRIERLVPASQTRTLSGKTIATIVERAALGMAPWKA